MCGLVGYYSRSSNGFDSDERKLLGEMLYVNALRGVDGTGVFYKKNNGDVHIYKEATESFNFIKSKEFGTIDSDLFMSGRFFVGHCRAATKGAKTDENCHPFHVDDKIILGHNGTYFGDHSKHAKTEVDSHAIAHVLSKEPDITTALKQINSAYALVWYNTETECLYLIRNEYRPLCFAETTTGDYIFASESWMIYGILARNGMKLKNYDNLQLLPHELITIDKDHKMTREQLDCKYVYETPPATSNTVVPFPPNPLSVAYSPSPSPKGSYSSVSGWRRSIVEIAEESDIGSINIKGVIWAKLFKAGEDIIAEVISYEKVTSNQTDKEYYIIAEILTETPKIVGTLYAFWSLMAENEDEVKQYIYGDDLESDAYFQGKFQFAACGKPKEKHRWVARLTGVIPLDVLPVSAVQQ